MNILNNFVKTYTDKTYKYTAQINHKGIVIAFAMDEARRIYYSVLDLENTQVKDKNSLDVNYWLDNPQEASFPNEIVQVGYAILPNTKMPLVKKGTREEAKMGTLRPQEVDPFLSTTARFTALASFQVLSDGKFIYLFRQAIDKNHSDMLYKKNEAGNFVLDKAQQKVPLVNETLLVDRYILAGTELKLKMEVRYQRSRHKYNPQTNKDGLGAKDLEKKPFYEPTQQLDFIRNLKDGRFNVLLLPTQIAELQRWQLFIHNSKTGLIDSFNVERSNDGLFNTKGTQLYTSPDPQYQSSVLERQPGKDSFTGQPLIPLISKSGYAESALSFDGQDDYIELPPDSIPTGNEITISFWAFGGVNLPNANSLLQALDANNGRVVNIHLPWVNGIIYFDCGNINGNFERIGKAAQESDFKGVWSHWAFTKNAAIGEMKIYLNGTLWHSGTGLTRPLPKTTKVRLGASLGRDFYNGSLDEVRIWNRCRSQAEIQADMNLRLVGDEPGLWAYWSFDEGFGDRLYDQTENAYHGSIKGGTWDKSDAPIGDNPGLQRTSFGLQSGSEQRNIASGLSALLYHQQEKATTGYDQAAKPVKRNARVMLTVATSGQNPASTDPHFIAALDFAVSREGKIAQVPDNLSLPMLKPSNTASQDLDAVSRLQEEIASLTASINQLEIDIAALQGSTQKIVNLELQKAQLETAIQSLTTDLNNKKQNIFNYFCRMQLKGNANFYEADSNGNVSIQPRNDNPGQYWRFFFPGYLDGSYKLCPSNHLTTNSDRFYKGKERGLIYGGSLKVDNWWYQVAGSWYLTNSNSNNYTCKVAGSSGYSLDLTITQTDRATSIITDVENALQNKKNELTNTINELNNLYINRDQLKNKEGQLALQKVQLENKQAELELMRSGIQGEIALPMSLLHTDSCGLTVAGSLLNFAHTKDTPLLVNSATGKVALYFRGVDDQFFATYYDTNTTKAQYLLAVETGKLSAIARSSEPECDRATFTITDGATPETCILTITNQVTGMEETWRNLPREAQQFCNVLNGGASQPIFIGKLGESAVGNPISSLILKQKSKQTLPKGSTLCIGNHKIIVSADISATADTIPITPTNLAIPPDIAVYLIPYDYDAWTKNNRTSNSLSNGSLQFLFQPGNSTGNVKNGTVNSSETTRSCQWVAESPGRALAFDGKDDYVGLKYLLKLPQFDTKGDLTLEAWVRPAQLAASCRVIHYNWAQSQYTLGIQSKSASCISALQLDGVNDYIELPPDSIPTGKEITISFWVFGGAKLPTETSFLEALDASNKRVLNIHLPWTNNTIYFDCGNINDNYDRIEKAAQIPDLKGVWSHWAFTKNVTAGEMKIYLNGKLWHSVTGQTRPLTKTAKVRLGWGFGGSSHYNCSLDEVRIWNKVRSEAEIQGDMNRRLAGNEAGLVAYWQFTGGIAKDYSANGYNGTIFGQPSLVASVIQENQICSFAGVGNQFQKSKEAAPMAQWHHLSAVYHQSYALQFKGNGFLECDHNPTLDLDRDLTIETFLQVDTFSQPQGILTKGKLGDGTDQNVPYSLYIDTDGKIAFAFEDKQGKSYTYKSSQALTVGQFYKIAVTRQYQNEVKNQGTADLPSVIVNQWVDIRFYINQKAAGYEIYRGADLDRNSQKLQIGKTYQSSQTNYLQGAIGEIRLWNSVVDLANLATKINGQEKGLVAWWRLEENEGNIAFDSKGESNAIIVAAQWVKNPDPQGSSLTLYQNGIPVPVEALTPQTNWGEQQFTLGGISQNTGIPLEPFAGTMEEVRIWKVARTQEQIQDNLFSRLNGEKQDLVANYTFDLESQTDLLDQSLIGNHLSLGLQDAKPTFVLSTAPISEDTAIVRSALAGVKTQFHDTIHCSPGVQEYSDLQHDIEGNLIGIQKRCYSYIKNGQWNLLTGYKVGNLITEWIGQVQADPQIIGYIEGAPPVPSENLTGTSADMDPYNGTAIQLVESDTVRYIYSSSKESGIDMSVETQTSLGFSTEVSAGLGVEKEVLELEANLRLKTAFNSSQGSVSEASTSSGYNTTKVSRLQTWGAWEKVGSEINSYVGRRYVPFNVGLALVQSDTMDVFALRLAHNNALVSYRFLPNPDIPKDWNIITFPINPNYTKQGTLDGKVGFKEDGSVQTDPHYPNAANYGQWSYFKPIEAYNVKKRIERERQELATYYDQYATIQSSRFQSAGSVAELRQMATRNLVNTYVWTADGGFFSESTDVLEATTETTTGSYSFQQMTGVGLDFSMSVGVSIGFELDAMAGGHLTTTKSKGRETEKSFALEVEVDVERDIQLYALTDALRTKYQGQYTPEEFGVYDANGNPIKQPGKVDAYRFMTFYLEPTTDNFEDFFGKVVDPIWLEQSSDPQAIALRQANQGEKKPSCWRVFHRVTFVSRILPEIAAQNVPPLEKAIRAANIESNWELIKKLEPFVQTKTQDFATFVDAVRSAISIYFPELQGYEEAIVQYMALYLGLDQVI